MIDCSEELRKPIPKDEADQEEEIWSASLFRVLCFKNFRPTFPQGRSLDRDCNDVMRYHINTDTTLHSFRFKA
jgi:hypothetical protein